MNRTATRLPKPILGAALLLVLAAIVMTSTSPAVGQATAPLPAPREAIATGYDLSWWTVDGGGDTHVSGGAYALGGTIGQLDAGGEVAGSPYSLLGGFWAQACWLAAPHLFATDVPARALGMVIPGLLANNLERQKFLPTLASLATVAVITYFLGSLLKLAGR
jgi:hypothetical protein